MIKEAGWSVSGGGISGAVRLGRWAFFGSGYSPRVLRHGLMDPPLDEVGLEPVFRSLERLTMPIVRQRALDRHEVERVHRIHHRHLAGRGYDHLAEARRSENPIARGCLHRPYVVFVVTEPERVRIAFLRHSPD